MASIDILTLSSTPPRQFGTCNMSSSPGLPSPSNLFMKKPQIIRSGSRAAPIPQNATASFTSAATLIQKASDDIQGAETIRSLTLASADIYDIDTTEPTKPLKPRTKKVVAKKDDPGNNKVAKPTRKPAAKKDEGDEVKKPRKPRAKKSEGGLAENGEVDVDENGDALVKEKAVRKPRAKKADGDTQAKISKGKVIKGSKAEVPSKNKVKNIDSSADSLDFGLVEAVKRRTAWTPPPPTSMSSVAPVLVDTSGEGLGLLESEEKTSGFTDLLGSFGFTSSDAHHGARKVSEGAGTRKRKLIELVNTNVGDAAVVAAAPKPKGPKKKARTITDQATSAYREDEAEPPSSPAPPAPLLQYFSYKDTVNNDGFKVPAKPRSKSPVKGGLKAKKGSAQAPILLSPESALKQVGNQDFVFGTSSQLAREESPTFLRDLHEAIQASNQIEDDPFFDILDSSSPLPAFSSRGKALASAKRTLWSAGARDMSGDLLDVEMIDMVDSPAVAKMLKASATQPSVTSLPTRADGWLDVEELSNSALGFTMEQMPATNVGPVERAIREELLSSPPRSSMQKQNSPRPSKAPKKPDIQEPSQSSTNPQASQAPKRPDYESYTTAQLTKEIASYRFKPVKNRDQMVTLLEKCWEGKNRVALGALGTNKNLSKSTVNGSSPANEPPASSQNTFPKRSRGRPRKDSGASLEASPAKPKTKGKVGRPKKTETVEFPEIDSDTPLSQIRTPKKPLKKAKRPVDEISDSDTLMTPSPPRRRASQLGTSPLPLRLFNPADEEVAELTPAELQASLFSHITKAVTSLPPSTDPLKPNWQEKILLYDPIVLEDLTLWLNTGALDKVGWDGEALAKEVKKWCESKSVCCLWRENLRGGSRSRY
ncbi:Structure-specific endonuclease subunit [Lachnellula occidentalis]|uniref:Structure-specific endonuclease subunit SLX4 n=1 Tax=Lachnellula occidentalis TaxID=215460 RepID=A0A8H8S5L8_9HELO|nr:Structure-specific endonuclease subunit [Lachnellula occidentalis]